MYSILPAVTALIFLGLGLYTVHQKGLNRVSASFLLLSVTTFFWQSTWAVLFQIHDPDWAQALVKLGYFFIIFLPTSIYQFLAEISGSYRERRYVYASYAFAGVLALVMLTTNLFVNGYYEYFWGYYPKAGPLHFLHVLQTTVVVCRGLYITWLRQKEVHHFQRARLRYCIASLLIYFFAALDYLCNYGVEFYPPGVIFILISFSIMTVAVVRFGLMDNPAALAASIAHEMRTPLMSIQMQAQSISKYLPDLLRGYQLAVDNDLCPPSIKAHHFERIRDIAADIENEVRQSHAIIDITLASAHRNLHKKYEFSANSMASCINSAIQSYPFDKVDRPRLSVQLEDDFSFVGSGTLMKYVVYNLIKNSLYAIRSDGGEGDVRIRLEPGPISNRLIFADTGPGIAADILPHIFDEFFTTKREGSGTGMGLSFCRRVVSSFNGIIECHSRVGGGTSFIISLPVIKLGDGNAGNDASQPGSVVRALG